MAQSPLTVLMGKVMNSSVSTGSFGREALAGTIANKGIVGSSSNKDELGRVIFRADSSLVDGDCVVG